MRALAIAFLIFVPATFAGTVTLGTFTLQDGTDVVATYKTESVTPMAGMPLCPMTIGEATIEANCPKHTLGVFILLQSLYGSQAQFYMIDCNNDMFQEQDIGITNGQTVTGPLSIPQLAQPDTLAGNLKVAVCRRYHHH